MKKTLLILLALTLTQLCYSQKPTNKVNITFGQEERVSKKITLRGIIAEDKTGIYVLKSKSYSKLILEHYNNKMNLIKSEELELKQGKKHLAFEGIQYINNKLYVFSSFRNKKLKKNFMFCQEISKNTLNLVGSIKNLSEISYEGYKRYSGHFDYETSNDDSKILIYNFLPSKKGEPQKALYQVFDDNFNLLWKKKTTISKPGLLHIVQDYELDNNGNVHILGTVYKDKIKETRHGEINYFYQIRSLYNNGKEERTYKVALKNKYITEMQLAVNDNGNFICAGFYSDQGTYSIKGSYFMTVDAKTQNIISQSTKDFSLNFITQNMTERQVKKTKKKIKKGKNIELYQYDLDELVLKDDGGAILIGEQYYVRVVTTTSTDANGNTRTTTTYHYYYNDIIAINMDKNGQITWAKKIPKYQHSVNDGGFYSSYNLSVVNNKLYFIFNDHPDNFFLKEGGHYRSYSRGKRCVLTLVELDQNGKTTREALFAADQAEIYTRPKVCRQINDNEVILFGRKKKNQKFIKLTFK